MVKNKCGFVGVGAYGGNQVRPFYKESYPSLFINTALTDLNSFQKWGGSLKEAFNTYSMANMLQDGVYKVVDAGKQGIETVKSFNDIKTDLAMATGENKTYINDLMQSYNALGQELGSITSDVAQSADSWLRQGRTMSETNQLIKDSMVLSKDAQMSSGDASKVLTSTLNGFQMEADEATAMAGSHRINTLYAAFENWDKVQMLTETAYNSEGRTGRETETISD